LSRALVRLVLVLLVASVAPARVSAQPVQGRRSDALSIEEFRSELTRIAGLVRTVANPANAPAVTPEIPSRWRVTVGEREQLEVGTRWLTLALDGASANAGSWPATREALARRLDHMREELATQAGGDGEARVHARTSVQTILSRDEFQQRAASRWREDVRERVTEWMTNFLARLGITGEAGARTVVILAWVIGLGALAGLGVWLARTMMRTPRQLLTLGSSSAPKPRAHDLAARALEHARAGNIREAVRIAYHATLVRLEEQGVWRLDAARTPREYVRMLSAEDARRAPLLDMTRRFEQIWYGHRIAGDNDATSVASHLEVLGCLRPGERAI
jgi:hypothetical protein